MPVTDQLGKLAAVEPAPCPVVSLYLNTQPGQTGRDQFQTFVRKEFAARGRTYPSNSSERESLEKDLQRIARYLDTELQPSANGVAIFACSAVDLFEAVQLSAPIEQHWLFVSDRPHLYPLARLESRYPRYAAVLADTNSARILVFAMGELVAEREVKGVKTRRNAQGGWSQARFQRHIENFHLLHAKEVIDALDDIVMREKIQNVLLAGDEVIIPLLREQMPKHLTEKVVDQVRLEKDAPLDEVLKTSLEAMRRVREQSDREKVDLAIGAYRAGGLGVVGPKETLDALVKGQVDELLVTANLQELQGLGGADTAGPAADELVTKAAQTSARITFVQDPELLADYGGVAALLRFRI